MKISTGSENLYRRGHNPLYDPLPHLRPHIRIAPFNSALLEPLLAITPDQDRCTWEEPTAWLDGANSLRFYARGRDAISACLTMEGLGHEDEVLIVTTTQGPYISSCVTDAIDAVCTWSRQLTPRTRLALVIHEFGFPCDSGIVRECQSRGIPVIEDCAYALGSRLKGASIGCFGDYAIYSLPKHFPIPFGGVLAARRDIDRSQAGKLADAHQTILISLLRNFTRISERHDERRRENWQWFAERMRPFGMEPYFAVPASVVPGTYVMRLDPAIDGAKLKDDLAGAGVEATQYYGMGGFYLPVHQFLTNYERSYILYHVAKSLGPHD